MKDFLDKIMNKPWVQHLMAMQQRYGQRLGPQFAAAVTYFSILSMVPILLFAISVTGFIVTVVYPEMWNQIEEMIKGSIGGGSQGQTIGEAVKYALEQWPSFGIVALLSAAYTGQGWVKNLKQAIRVMWRDRFSDAAKTKGMVKEILINLGIFLGLLVCVALAFGTTIVGVGFSETIINALGLQDVPGINIIVRLITIALTLVAGFILFAYVFFVFPGERTDRRTFLIGAGIGAILVMIVQQFAGVLFGLFASNKAAAVFGPVLVLMLVFNTLATIILMLSAWIGTADNYEEELERGRKAKAAGRGIDVDDDDDLMAPPPAAAAQERFRLEREKDVRNHNEQVHSARLRQEDRAR